MIKSKKKENVSEANFQSQDENGYFVFRKILQFIKSDSFFLFLLPIVGYFITFLFQVGQFSFFQVPIEMISFEPIQFIWVGFCSLSFLTLYYFLYIIFNLTDKLSEKIKKTLKIPLLIIAIITILIGLPIFYVGIFDNKNFSIDIATYYALLCSIIISIGIFISELINRLYSNKKNEKKDQILIVFVIIAICIGYFPYLGFSQAQDQKRFYVINNYPECVVLHFSSDKFYCRTIDRKKHQLLDALLFIPIDEKVRISYEELGQLTFIKYTPNSFPKFLKDKFRLNFLSP